MPRDEWKKGGIPVTFEIPNLLRRFHLCSTPSWYVSTAMANAVRLYFSPNADGPAAAAHTYSSADVLLRISFPIEDSAWGYISNLININAYNIPKMVSTTRSNDFKLKTLHIDGKESRNKRETFQSNIFFSFVLQKDDSSGGNFYDIHLQCRQTRRSSRKKTSLMTKLDGRTRRRQTSDTNAIVN